MENKELEVPSVHRSIRLRLKEDKDGTITIIVVPANRASYVHIAFAYAEKDRCRVRVYREDDWSLWIGSANFKIAPKHADAIVDLFGIPKEVA